MKSIICYLKDYFHFTDRRIFIPSLIFIAAAIFINYNFNLNEKINAFGFGAQYLIWSIVFFTAFSFPYLLLYLIYRIEFFRKTNFIILLILAPLIFAWKMSFPFHFWFSSLPNENKYWNIIIYWPLKLLIVSIALFVCWKVFDKEQRFYGWTLKGFNPRPYFIMLLIMMPLIAIASAQPDFLIMYPKLKTVIDNNTFDTGIHKLLYELSYGSDFLGIELFFRGFLVLAFIKYAGKGAILPMAIFYCTIHFGKPLGECISSFWGGLVLGVITYHTKSIFGGLMVHLGIAWLMELGGYLGNLYK